MRSGPRSTSSGSGRGLRVLYSGLHFAESPRWRDGSLWLSDIRGGRVVAVAGDGSLAAAIDVPGEPGGLGWLPDGRLLVVSTLDRHVLRLEADGSFVVHADLSRLTPWPLNDMLVDGAGRCYVGGFGFDYAGGAAPVASPLYRVAPDGAVDVGAEGFDVPNGMALDVLGAELIVAESAGRRLSALSLASDGAITGRRVWADLRLLTNAADSRQPVPDGICLDAERAVWLADNRHGRVLRVGAGGVILDRVDVPMSAFACELGGPAGRTLFVCGANLPLSGTSASLLATEVPVARQGYSADEGWADLWLGASGSADIMSSLRDARRKA